MNNSSQVYEFIFRGLLTEEALNRSGRKNLSLNGYFDIDLASVLSLDLLDDTLVEKAKRMASVYTAVAAFENSARKLISSVLLEEVGEDWWGKCVSEKIRKRAESKRNEEERVRWHTQRGEDPINYTQMADLGNIIRQNWGKFEPYIPSVEWAASVFDTIERSRNVIMHSGYLDREDIERIGINIRDWVKQVGT